MRRSFSRWVLCAGLLMAPGVAVANEPAPSHEAEHAPTFDDVNWFYGMLGTSDDPEPSVLFRPKGMPAPFAALALNALLLYFILYSSLKKPVAEGLLRRKENLLRGMEDAAAMRREAEGQLQAYERKLANIDRDVEELRTSLRQAVDAENARILAEAKERRERMERDARLLVEQELKAVKQQLLEETVASAVRSAERLLREHITEADQQRFADEYVAGLRASARSLGGRP
jgi:F-type H+-transporting ATPase subunit b